MVLAVVLGSHRRRWVGGWRGSAAETQMAEVSDRGVSRTSPSGDSREHAGQANRGPPRTWMPVVEVAAPDCGARRHRMLDPETPFALRPGPPCLAHRAIFRCFGSPPSSSVGTERAAGTETCNY